MENGAGFGEGEFGALPSGCNLLQTPLQYGTSPTDDKYSLVSTFALLNSEPFNKRDSILGKYVIPFYTAPTYIFFE